jgi:hypothetical protein
MRHTSRGRVVTGGVAIAVIAGFIGVASLTASGDDPPPVELEQDRGTLALALSGNSGTVTFTAVDGTQVTQQISANSQCRVATTGPALLTFTPSATGSPTVGLVNNGLGVRTKNNCAVAEGRIGAGQGLAVALGGYFADPEIVVDRAELDIEGKFGASLGVTYDGVVAEVFPLTTDADNGPDTGVGANSRVVIGSDVNFRSVVLRAAGGEVALDGGGDASFQTYVDAGQVGPLGQQLGTAASVFQLVSVEEFDHAVDCLDAVSATLIGFAADSAEFVRGLNDGAESADDCDDIGVTLEVQDEGVLLHKSTTGLSTGQPEAVNATVEIVWTPQPAEVPLPARQINFEGDPNGIFEDVQWCTSHDAVAGTWNHPVRSNGSEVPWCLISDTATLLVDGSVQQVQQYHGRGDPYWK